MLKREELLAGLANAATRVTVAPDPEHRGELANFCAFVTSVEENLRLVRPTLQRILELDHAGRVDEANALRQQLFSTVSGLAVAGLCVASHYPWLAKTELPENLKELYGHLEVKH